MAIFRAAVPLNLRWQHPSGEWLEIAGELTDLARDGRAKGREPVPAGAEFEVPDHLAAAFEDAMGPRPNSAGQASVARIPGLIRLHEPAPAGE